MWRLIRHYDSNKVPQAIFLDAPVQLSYQGAAVEHQTIYDLLGFIISVAGSSPPGATRESYYYRLCTLYGAWCRKLAPSKETEPALIQMTWFDYGGSTRVLVGANLDDPKPHAKKVAVQGRRADAMVAAGWLTAAQKEQGFTNVRGGAGHKYGHCAETLPFLMINGYVVQLSPLRLELWLISNRIRTQVANVAGLAIKTAVLLPEDRAEAIQYDEETFLRAMHSPCANCTPIITTMGFNVARFERYYP